MDELKLRATEKIGALQEAAKTAAGSSKTRVQDVAQQTSEALRKVREAFLEVWHNELIAESRERITAWARDAVQRVKEGTPPLSPILLYEELVALFKDRVWRRSMLIFICGVAVGGSAGLAAGLRVSARPPLGPHARALHTQRDHAVMLVEDAVAPGAGCGEVLVRVQALSVCPVDRAVLRGRGAALRALLARGPLTVGRGFAGVVLDVGHGVSELEMGDEVWGCVSEWAGGAASELLTVRSSRVSKRPRSVGADGAAALPWAGTLALTALDTLQYTPTNCKGKRVAVIGAGSGEGCVLVQLLSAWGAHVTVLAARHSAMALQDMGAKEFVDTSFGDQAVPSRAAAGGWAALEAAAGRSGPWDAVLATTHAAGPSGPPGNPNALLKATAPRAAILDLRPRALLSDRLPAPLFYVFAASFHTYRFLRWAVGLGSDTDWLEPRWRLSPGLAALAALVDNGHVAPVLDKVYLPQDFENALAHACSEDAIGTTVIRFP